MVKQVIVMRKDLNMRKGKMIAQGAHASMNAVLQLLGFDLSDINVKGEGCKFPNRINTNPVFDRWKKHGYTKICLYVNSEEELLDIYNKAKEKNLTVSIITDSGRTEFGGKPTKTCLAIGPDKIEEIDKITGHLPLL